MHVFRLNGGCGSQKRAFIFLAPVSHRPFTAPNACVDRKDLVNITWYETGEQLLKSIDIRARLSALVRGSRGIRRS
jgi:hypothetical protein